MSDLNHCDRRDFLRWSAAAALVGRAGAQTRRPNFLFIITDDQNPDTLGCWGGQALTPRLDALAARGVKLLNNYVHSAVCSASRYTCLTGRYPANNRSAQWLDRYPAGTQTNFGWDTNLEQDRPNLPNTLRAAGYRTGFCGKWHVGGTIRGHRAWARDAAYDDPTTQRQLAAAHESMRAWIRGCGFDFADAVYWGNTADYALDTFNTHNPEWITDAGLRFLDEYGSEPFFLYYSTTIHHGPSPQQSLLRADPRVTPAGRLERAPEVQPSRPSVIERTRAAGLPEQRAFCTWLDDGVGALLDKIEALGQTDNTVVVFFSDNGNPGKGTCYESGGHTPCFVTWPGHFRAGAEETRLTSNIDFAATLLDLAGAPLPDDCADGRSLRPLLAGEPTEWRDSLYLEIGHARAIVAEGHKYYAVRHAPAIQRQLDAGTLGRPAYHADQALDLQITAARVWPHYFDRDQLYDLTADPREQRNLSAEPDRAELLTRQRERLNGYLHRLGRPFGEFGPR